MARGITPRRPSRSGRHEAARRATRGSGSTLPGKKLLSLAATKSSIAKARVAKKTAANGDYNPTAPERVAEILKRLDATYPGVTCALQHRSAWQLLVATILSAQCTDVRVNIVTPELFKKYPTVEDMAAASPEQIEPDIRSTGFFRNKSKSLVGAAKKIVQDFRGEVPSGMGELLSLPGVARKTANVVLGTWFRKGVGVVVDTHVTRIARRLELTRAEGAPKIEQNLMRVIPQAKWIDFAHQLIWHGRSLCYARKPKCAECPLENICHAADKTWSTVPIHKSAAP